MAHSERDAAKPFRMRLMSGLALLSLVCCSSPQKQTGTEGPEQGTWTPLPSGAPMGTGLQVASVFDGQNVLLWGGLGGCTVNGVCGDGARFNLEAKTWTPLSTQGAPSARTLHSAVWTGEKMIVWGGLGCGSPLGPCGDGATYDPATDTWSAITSQGAPSPRGGHTATWTGEVMVVWGGQDLQQGRVFGDGARYHVDAGIWTTLNLVEAPVGRRYHSAVWTGELSGEVLYWGGNGGGGTVDVALADGSSYGPFEGHWLAMPTEGAPTGRWAHTAVWTGAKMIIWGGIGCGDDTQDPPVYCEQGAAYDPVDRKWSPVSARGAPSPRTGHSAVWTGSKMVIWGGASPKCGSGGGACSDGAAYDPETDTWAPLRTEGAPSARSGHVGVWTGNALFIWGGMGGGGAEAPLSDGALWVP
ncbi:hypothetical protein D7V80_07445 [Corallococcus sp. CA054B]|uniref:Kelch repeat-containing protein n=1 Tax=Corallococcus sp. CA054B TaxID=2316734 RepID=UPI000EA186BC|nr:hypothetical protein [Corallococcus sp. CA054B]RKG69858.1 hypothetical protein D7V80_07445 [Corallococcus sp. CA054B]